ncbi:MAG: hypothetical protein QW279_12125, partial [Candidatus Jordarchaeaceae archaeon]
MTNNDEVRERKINIFAPLMLEWGKKNLRKFPWRKELDNPYKILCTEILLQKTSVEKVLSVYHKFFERFPTEKQLSKAKIEDVVAIRNFTFLIKRNKSRVASPIPGGMSITRKSSFSDLV